jgi:hypothetical protein
MVAAILVSTIRIQTLRFPATGAQFTRSQMQAGKAEVQLKDSLRISKNLKVEAAVLLISAVLA